MDYFIPKYEIQPTARDATPSDFKGNMASIVKARGQLQCNPAKNDDTYEYLLGNYSPSTRGRGLWYPWTAQSAPWNECYNPLLNSYPFCKQGWGAQLSVSCFRTLQALP